jgi:rRNA-processing protein FCF1
MQSRIVVILDTNMLLVPFQFSINLDKSIHDLLGTVEVVVPSSVLLELEGLAQENSKAKSAIKFAKKYNVVEVKEKGDRGIMEAIHKFEDRKVYIATQDRNLCRKIRKMGYEVIILREGQRLAFAER